MTIVEIPTIQFRQKGLIVCLFHMKADRLVRLVKSRPKTSDDVEGIQRILDKRKLASIARYISTPNGALPNNIIVNFNNEVKFVPTTTSSIGNIVFPSADGHYGELLDGQHRLYGVVHSDSTHKDLDLPVTGLMLDNPKLAGQIFADINSNQTPVSKVLLIALQRELGLLPETKDAAAAIVERLNEDMDSPLKDKIKMFQDEKGRYLTNDQMIKALITLLVPAKTLGHLPIDLAVNMLKNYLSAISKTYPTAWGHDKSYYITRPAGMNVVLDIFERARERTRELFPSEDQFVLAIEPIKDFQWDGSTFTTMSYTGSGGRARLRDELLIKLPPPSATSTP